MQIRRFEPEDAREVSALIIKTLRETSIRDYSREYIEDLVTRMGPEDILKKAQETHYYVFCDEGRIAGCGAIGPYEGKTEESVLSSVFVLPEYQGTGLGRQIMQTLEEDAYFLRAERIEIPASITAVNFYRKLGYDFKNGDSTLGEGELYRLEKWKKRLPQSF
ncbi:GNAT family N-acetyltransferase [Candidatus Bariatricus faecipullorum]